MRESKSERNKKQVRERGDEGRERERDGLTVLCYYTVCEEMNHFAEVHNWVGEWHECLTSAWTVQFNNLYRECGSQWSVYLKFILC